MKITAPKFFTQNSIPVFLKDSSTIFSLRFREEKNFILDVSNIKKISLFGQLLLYKFISFTAENKCFYKPSINGLYQNEVLRKELSESGFWKIIVTFVHSPDNQKKITESYEELKTNIKDNILLAPLKLLRSETNIRQALEKEYFEKISSFYNSEISSTICFCLGELFTNFWSHATEDSGTIMVAKGDHNSIDIYFADTGAGIINTFKFSDAKYQKWQKKSIMRCALEKNVTSKPNSNHLGMGLYMLKCITLNNKDSIFHIISDEVEYIQSQNKPGVIKDTSFWNGTITHLKLNIKNLMPLSQIKELYTPTIEKIQFL